MCFINCINGVDYDSDTYTKLFYSHNILRPSCFECKYKCISRLGDVTIADYWGIDKAIPGFNDNKGVSLVLVNTEKGLHLFDEAKIDVEWKEAALKDSMQNSLRVCYQEPFERKQFWINYQKNGFSGYLKNQEHLKNKKRFFGIGGRFVRVSKRFVVRIWRKIY